MTANTGGKGPMDGKSLFEKVQTMLREGAPTSIPPAKVRAVTPLVIGAWVEFRSPLFGLCTGRVLSLEVESIRIGEHSVTKEVVTIPQDWIVRTLEEV